MGGGSKIKPPKKEKKDKQKASDKSGGKKQSTDMPPIGAHAGGASKASSSGGQRKTSTQSETSFSKQHKASTHQQGASSQTEPKRSKWRINIFTQKQQSSVNSQQDAQDVLALTQSQSSPPPPQLPTWSSFGAAEVANQTGLSDFEKQTDGAPFLESSSKSPDLLVDALEETPVKSKHPVECARSPLSKDEEQVTTGAGYSTQASETQKSRMERAAQRARETDANSLQKQLADNQIVKDQLKALQEEFLAKRKERQELQAKLKERDENQKLLEIKVDELNDTNKQMTEACLTEMQTKEALLNKLNEQVKDLKEKLKTKENERKICLDQHQNHLDTRLKELTEAHRTEMETKEASFNERAQQWKGERGTFELELKRMQAEFLLEKERYGIALNKSVDVECELIKLREIQKGKEGGEALKVQRLEAHIEKNEKTVKEVKDELETAKQTIINLNRRRKADLDELETLKEEKEVEIRKAQTTTDRANELTLEVDILQKENDKLSKQLKGSTLKSEAPQTETNQMKTEILSQQRFDDKLREETDKIHEEWEAKIQSLQHEHEQTIVQLNKENALKIATLTEELEDALDKEQKSHQDVQDDMAKDLEKQANRHKEESIKLQNDYKTALAESNQKHQKELTAQRERARKLELKYQTELKKERKKRDGYIEDTMDHESPGHSPEQTRRKAKVEMEIEQQDQFQQKIADLKQENDYLRTQLTDQQQHARYLQSELENKKELYRQLQIQVLAKQQLDGLPSVGDDNVLPFPNHNPLTSSPSSPESTQLQSVSDHPLQSSEGPQHDSEDEVYHSLGSNNEDNRTDSQKLDESRQETQLLRTKLQELQATNDQLTQAIKITLSEQPVSETGVMESADTSKKLVHMKTMYLQQLNKAMEAQEALEESKTEKIKLALKLETSKKSLTEKIQEKDRELQQLRRGSASVEHPPTSKSLSVDGVDDDDLPDDADPIMCISELKAALKSKKEQVESLRCQVNSFEQIATQRQQLQSNSKIQSMVVLKLKKQLETVETELELARKNAERMANTNTELADLQQEKEDIEDDKHCLEMEMSADRERLQDVMKQLADSHSTVKSMEKSLKARPGDAPVSEDDKDREIQMLKSEVHLAQIEIKGHRQSAEKSRKFLADIEKQRQTLERKLVRSNQERDSLANDILKVKVESRALKSRLTSVGTEHEAAIEIAESLTKAIENKDSEAAYLRQEKMELEEKLKQSDNELQIVQIQAQQYVEDFEQERRDRENAFSIKDDDFGKFQVQVQMLRDELKGSQEMARNERREKQEVIANLEVAIKERQQKQSQLAQAHNDFELFFQLKDKEIKQLTEEKQKLSIKYENQLKQVGIQNMQLQTDLKKKIDQLQATLQKQTEQAETVTAEKLSLEEQHEKTTREFKLKEKQLEIAANEKAAISNEIAARKNEVAQAKITSGRMGVELQAARERLEIAIADGARLHDEVMAKTAQVKQYKKQTDSFKAKVEEANTKLLKTQQELQRCKELIKTMEEDNQYHIEQAKATAESDKLAAEMVLIQSQRRVEAFERELQELRNSGEIPEAVRIEVDRRIEVEQKLIAAEAKCSELMDKCNTRYQAIEKLKGALAQHSIAIPAYSIDKIEKIPVLPQHQQPVSPVTQRGGYPRDRAGYEQRQGPAFNTNQPIRCSTEPQNSIPPHSHVRTVPPRVQEDGAQYWESNHQMPPTSQAQLPAQNRMDTGPPIRASDPGTQQNMDQHYQGGQQNQQMTNDPQQPMYQYEQGGQQTQPNQWQGGYQPNLQGGYDPNQQGRHNPNQQGGFNQDPRQNQQLQQGYAQGGPSFNHHGQQHHRGHQPPPRSPNYQQAQNYPPTSYAQGNPSPYHQHEVNQSQQPPRGMPQSQAPFTPQNPVQPQQMVSHQENPPTARGQLAPEVQPTPLPRRNSNENLPRRKQSSSVQENILLQDIDRDIKDAAKFVIHEGDESESMAPDAPFDPNLICPLCMRNFRVGEIQKYRKHVNTCQG